ncbi:YlxR family protein [bacterium]|nr:YlxR family protein [bacterium]
MEPIRTCLSCGKKLPKGKLIRLARLQDGRIDMLKEGGRGAYLCGAEDCIRKAFKGNRLARALRIKGNIDPSILEELANKLKVITLCEKL